MKLDKAQIIVLGGGKSPEREVSLRSAEAVSEAVKKLGHNLVRLDPGQDKDYFDYIQPDSIVLPILHGEGGEDGVLQEQLELRGVKYLGSSSSVSKICFDKGKTRQVLQSFNLPVAEGDVIGKDEYQEHPLSMKPHVLKVSRGGSSIGTVIVRDPQNIDISKTNAVFDLDSVAVIEELVEGVELTVPILGDRTLQAIEIKPPVGEEFDYTNKYNGATAEVCPPVSVDNRVHDHVREIALRAHQALGCRHLSRVDIIVGVTKTVILEINTMPGLTKQSLYPKAAAAEGITFANLVGLFIELADKN